MNPPKKDRRLAAALALIVPGLGHFYADGCVYGLVVCGVETAATFFLFLVAPLVLTVVLASRHDQPDPSDGFAAVVASMLAYAAMKAVVC